jgi:hypothetical protein
MEKKTYNEASGNNTDRLIALGTFERISREMFHSGSDKYYSKTKEHTQGSVMTRAIRLKTPLLSPRSDPQ